MVFELLSIFLPAPGECRKTLRLPMATTIAEAKMQSTCVCHNQVCSMGFACSNCLALHCYQPAREQLEEILSAQKAFKKMQSRQATDRSERDHLVAAAYPKLQEAEIKYNSQRQCANCHKLFAQ